MGSRLELRIFFDVVTILFQTLPRGELLLLEKNILVPVRRAPDEGGSLGHLQGIQRDFTGNVHEAKELVQNVNSQKLSTIDSEAVEESAKIGR